MPSFVNPEKCDGCKAQDKTACQYVCPNDLMVLDKATNKAYNQEPDLCWECYSCVKICPTQAIDVRGYADFVPLGGSVTPLRGTDSIMWTVQFRNGKIKRFKFPTRTKPEGAIQPFADMPEPTPEGLKAQELAGEPKWLMIEKMARLEDKG
jgi:adenylylsulfate reductase, subunit B